MKKLLFFILTMFPLLIFSQSKKITLPEAIGIAQKKSPDYKSYSNINQSSYWRFKNYKASFLPQLSLNALYINGGVSLSQNVPYTGGTLSLYSNLDRIELFGLNDNISYSVVPFSLGYNQNSLFYNAYKWDKKIEPLIYEESKRNFVENMEQISLTTCRRYFSLLKAQIQLKSAEQNLSNQDTLLQISQGRFKIGKIAENELLQMELTMLNSKNEVTTNTIALKKSSQDLARYLELNTEHIELGIPEELSLFEIDVKKALEEAQSNRKAVIEFRRKRLEAEKNLAREKGSNRLAISLNANFGVSQNGNDFNNLFNDYNKQQNISLNVSMPIFDWGVSKSQRKMAEANLDLVNNNIEQDKQAFEQEIYLHVLNWSSQRDFLATAKKAKDIAIKSYDISKKRYVLGKITITDLNIALQKKDDAVLRHLNSLEQFWLDYYTLRQLTLFDFINNKKIEVEDVFYD